MTHRILFGCLFWRLRRSRALWLHRTAAHECLVVVYDVLGGCSWGGEDGGVEGGGRTSPAIRTSPPTPPIINRCAAAAIAAWSGICAPRSSRSNATRRAQRACG